MFTYLITGANRGIGLEFVKQLLASGNKVIAASRNSSKDAVLQELAQGHKDRLTLLPLDVTDESQIKGIGAKLQQSHPNGIDYLINNAGVAGIEYSDKEDFLRTFNTHVVGPYLIFMELLPLLQKGTKKVVVNVGSLAGSLSSQKPIADFSKASGKAGGFYAYRVSKAAENALSAVLGTDDRYQDFIIVSLYPGTVATDMTASTDSTPFAEFGPEVSVTHQLKTIHGLTKEKSGKFLHYSSRHSPTHPLMLFLMEVADEPNWGRINSLKIMLHRRSNGTHYTCAGVRKDATLT